MHDKAKFAKSVMIIRLICPEKYENDEKEKLTIKINELILELIKESFIFSSRERLRKNIIECFYYYKDDQNEIKKDIIDLLQRKERMMREFKTLPKIEEDE